MASIVPNAIPAEKPSLTAPNAHGQSYRPSAASYPKKLMAES
jgi:hypothetical protein